MSEASVINESCQDDVNISAGFYPILNTFADMTGIINDDWARWKAADLALAGDDANITILDTTTFQSACLVIRYELNGKEGKVELWSRHYGMTTNGASATSNYGQSSGKAVLIVPGSGNNQTVHMMNNAANVPGTQDYQNILFPIGTATGDAYVYQWPGQDLRALIGSNYPTPKKLLIGFIENLLIMAGTSTATLVSIEMAVAMKWLRTANSINSDWPSYTKIGVLGLSKGAFPALMCAMMTEPTACVVASGFSLKEFRSQGFGEGGGNIPNINDTWDHDTVVSTITGGPTKFYYTASTAVPETAIMLEEAATDETADALAGANFTYNKHAQGHCYPSGTLAWLQGALT